MAPPSGSVVPFVLVSVLVIDMWNSSPADMLHSGSIQIFKRHLDLFARQEMLISNELFPLSTLSNVTEIIRWSGSEPWWGFLGRSPKKQK